MKDQSMIEFTLEYQNLLTWIWLQRKAKDETTEDKKDSNNPSYTTPYSP